MHAAQEGVGVGGSHEAVLLELAYEQQYAAASYSMDYMSADSYAKVRKQMAFDREPIASAIVEIVELNLAAT